MPPPYAALPSKEQWKKDLGLYTVLGNFKSPFPAMERIGKLLAAAERLPAPSGGRHIGIDVAGVLSHLQCVFYINNATSFVIKYAGNRAKLGGVLEAKQLAAVKGLQAFACSTLKTNFGATDANLEQIMLETYGREVNSRSQAEDIILLGGGMLLYYTTPALQAAFKLSFRNGLAHRWSWEGKGKGSLEIYDTERAHDEIEHHGSLYVMDGEGHIFVNGKKGDVELKHSSFLGGLPTLCAGEMRIENGQVLWLSGRSGHYQPTVAQVVSMLERLGTYGVKLDKVTVFRENYTKNWTNPVWKCYEPVPALTLLKLRRWNTAVQPDSMRVG